MKKSLAVLTTVAVLMGLFSSCLVPKKKLTEAQKQLAAKETENNNLKKAVAARDAQINKLTDSLGKLNQKLAEMMKRNHTLSDSVNSLTEQADELAKQLAVVGSENQNAKKQLSSTNERIAEQQKKLAELQEFIAAQQRATEALKKKIEDALSGFNSSELTITRKNGKVYISMQEGLLFPSGSASLNPKGKEALAKVASVLNTTADINIDIEGHTDSIPIHTAVFADNWALSTARATSIAHVLIDDYKVQPAKLVASGRSQFDPIAPNSTAKGRAANRRTEIILEPKLDELMELLNGKQKN
jgi:chemotaxis protein MotB